MWDFPDGPVGKTHTLNVRGPGLTPDWGTKIPHTATEPTRSTACPATREACMPQ